jgi:trans-aconitate methyltransferase
MSDKRWDPDLYDDKHSFVWRNAVPLLELLRPRPGERLLDLGCGTGHLTAQLAGLGLEVVALDRSTEMIAQARRNYPGLTFEVGDARDFTALVPFDVVLSNAALHWVR